jgi:hypothetical protein
MNKPSHKTHAEELQEALDRIHELQEVLRERCYLHPMNLQSNVENIQIMLPVGVHIAIGKEGIYLLDLDLEFAISCQPTDLPDAIDIKRYLDSCKPEGSMAYE